MYLEALVGDNQGKSLGLNHYGNVELRWDRAVLADGGVEPIEWAPELEPSPEAPRIQS